MNPQRDSLRTVLRAGVRRVLRQAATRMLLPDAGENASPAGNRITIVGLLRSPTGLGEGGRLAAEAFAELGLSVGMVDLTERFKGLSGVALPDRPGCVEADVGGPLVVHLNPPAFQTALLRLRLSGRDRPLIAYWAWELETVPVSWHATFRLAHEIWVPSHYVREALVRSGCLTPVRVVPHPVRATPPGATPTPEGGPLRVLTLFDYDSDFERKNPLASVAAFRMAFGSSPAALLLIKAQGRSRDSERAQALSAAISGAENIRLIDQVLGRTEQEQLIGSADVLLSLHRSEGFGLSLAEAMARGKPVVATAWSGNLEFMTEESACLIPALPVDARAAGAVYRRINSQWAEPSISAAAQWLSRLADPALRERIGAAARTRIAAQLGSAGMYNALRNCRFIPALTAPAQLGMLDKY